MPRLAAALVHAGPQPHGDAGYRAELASHRWGPPCGCAPQRYPGAVGPFGLRL